MKIAGSAAEKGGIGKTMIAVNLTLLAAEKKKVPTLITDADKQSNASKFFLPENYEDVLAKRDEYIFTRDLFEKHLDLTKKKPYQVKKNLWLIPASRDLAEVEKMSDKDLGRFRDNLKKVGEQFGFKLNVIDTPPSNETMQKAALMACDTFFTPTGLGSFDFGGVVGILEIQKWAQEKGNNPALSHVAIVGSRIKTWETKKWEGLHQEYGEIIIKTPLCERQDVHNTPMNSAPAYALENKKASNEWLAVCKELYERITQ